MNRTRALLVLCLSLCLACDSDTPADGGLDASSAGTDGGRGDAAGALDAGSFDAHAADAARADGSAADDAPADAGPPPLGGSECEVGERVDEGPLSATRRTVRPSCLDPRTIGLSAKTHVVYLPDSVDRELLYVHLVGSGGRPSNSENVLRVAALSGMRAVGLAYMNEPSVAERCTDPDTGLPRPTECEGLVRYEVVSGVDVTDYVQIRPQDAIVFRLRRLLEFLDAQHPSEGWDAFLSGAEIAWERVVLSGFSQGGGMAGMIARDHELARVLYLSKGAGAVSNAAVDPASAPSCEPDPVAPDDPTQPCEAGRCCLETAPDCSTPPDSGGRCLYPVPAPWAYEGRDTDGDGIGDGDASTRATPASTSYAIVHRDEDAWAYSPDVFREWGMDTFGGWADADNESPPYGGTHLISTGLAPPGGCTHHLSIGNDACQPSSGGRPAMAPAWRHVMTVGL